MSDSSGVVPSPPNRDAWFMPGRFAATLATLLLATFWKILFAGEAMFYRDYGFLGYPFLYFHREAFWRGELPFWNPYVNCGAPFLAQWNTLVLYPGSLIYLLLPMPWSVGLFCVAHVFLAGFGMYFLAYRWAADRFAATVAGVAFAFSGLMFASLIYPNYLVTLGWMPWVVLSVERGWREGKRWLVIAAITGALQMVTGAPEILLLTWLLLLAMALGDAWTGKDHAAEKLTRFGLIVGLITGLTAIQLLPFFDLLAHSQRSASFAGGFWSMPAWGWANLVVPLFHYARTPQGTYVQAGQSFFPSYYLGVLTLTLALLASAFIRRKRVWLLAGATVFSLSVALGENSFLYGTLKQIAPVLGFARYPIKFVALAAFALPLLAAMAVAQWRSPESHEIKPTNRPMAITSGLVYAAMAVIAWQSHANPLRSDDQGAFMMNLCVHLAIMVTAVSIWLFRHQWSARPWQNRMELGIVLLIVLDGLTTMPNQIPSVQSWVFTPGLVQAKLQLTPAPALGKSRVMLSSSAEYSLHRRMLPDFQQDFLGERLALWYNLNILDGIPKVNGASTLQAREQLEVENLIYTNTNDLPRLADFLGASHVTAPGEVMQWQARTSNLPLVTAGQMPIFAEPQEILRQLSGREFRPDRQVYLEPEARALTSVTNASSVRISAIQFELHSASFEAEAAQPALAVIAQTFYHPWRAYVNGQPVRLLRANHGFQALELPAGKSRVELCYEDQLFRIGAALSLATLAACCILWRRA